MVKTRSATKMAENENDDLETTVRELGTSGQNERVTEQIATMMQEIESLKTALRQQQNSATATADTNSVSDDMAATPLAAAVSELSRALSHTPRQPVIRLYDLPEFDGRPEDWPMFCEAFKATTEEYRYTERQNMLRLQKALKGKARETVECLLIHHSNVNRVLDTLKERFGRPELLVKSQISRIRNVSNIPENRIDLIIPFSTKVQNLASFLAAADCDHHLSNPILMEELVSKLPVQRKLAWARHSMSIQPRPTIQHLSEWLQEEARIVNTVCNNVGEPQRLPEAKPDRRSRFFHASEQYEQEGGGCKMCSGNHDLEVCRKFLDLQNTQKWRFVRQKRLCFSCLKSGHRGNACKRKHTCANATCDKQWHELLHESRPQTNDSNQQVEQRPRILTNASVSPSNEQLLFKIIAVKLFANGKTINCYALLDEGSSLTLLNEKIADALGVSGPKGDLTLQWFGSNTVTEPSMAVSLEISGAGRRHKRFPLRNVRTVRNLNLPTQTFNISELPVGQRHLMKLPVGGYTGVTPDLLIGLDNVHLGIAKRIAGDGQRGPAAILTKLGWVIYGSTGNKDGMTKQIFLVRGGVADTTEEEDSVEELVKKFVISDDLKVSYAVKQVESQDDVRAKAILQNTTVRKENRFETGLLWKDDTDISEHTRQMAENRLLALERKFKNDEKLKQEYISTMRRYEEKGYSRKLTKEETAVIHPRTWYLPHFGVYNLNKQRKVRLVFDAAAQVSGRSLNSYLLSGPDLGKPMLEVLMRFRQRPIAVSADIEEMFHQVAIRAEDQPAQRFLWRESTDAAIEEYSMQVMTFGATCSPCAAQYVKNKNASDNALEFPEAADAIVNNHYVDDFVHCFESEEEAVRISEQVKYIHLKAGFHLRKFVSNSHVVCKELNGMQNFEATKEFDDVTAGHQKVLGMQWDTTSDVLKFVLAFGRIDPDLLDGKRVPTKRELLRVTMSVFDPFGIAAESVLEAKLLLQMVWRAGTGWDDYISDEAQRAWKKWLDTLSFVEGIKVPRCYSTATSRAAIELHIFADASEVAFAAVAYWRIESGQEVDIAFVAGKAKCAPLKLTSIPRLELQAAVLASRLRKMVVSYHDVKPERVIMWTDSKTVHAWIASDHRKYKPYVAHRVNEILDMTDVEEWRWIPGALNPADFGTRPRVVGSESRWITGPAFLGSDESRWPGAKPTEGTSEELRPRYNLFFVTHNEEALLRFSSFLKLTRVVAYMIRFIHNCRTAPEGRRLGTLKVSELREAELQIIQTAQQSCYADEYATLKNHHQLNSNSRLYKLTPILDEAGIMRVNGRLQNANNIQPYTRQPIIMPQQHHVTKILVDHYHRLWKHQNENTIVAEIRRKYWIPHIREEVRKAARRCTTCQKERARPAMPLMGQLPADRLTPFVRPFTYVGLDYMGPFLIAIGRRTEKRWIALFTCLTTRAVHLEIAKDLSADSCLLCIKSFMCRRGTPMRIRSDNGTNFISADREMRKQLKDFQDGKIANALSTQGIEWVFNCPLNPHAGGCWERLVRSVKRAMQHALNSERLPEQTLYSVMCEAENVVNSRPLTHIPIDAPNEEPLTPNHFLLGTANSEQTPHPEEESFRPTRTQWRKLQQIHHRFWKRWLAEYLPDLCRRTKWWKPTTPLSEGDLVMVCDARLHRSQWPMGRVVQVKRGQDGQVRVAEIKTAGGTFRRPACMLAKLDVGESSSG